MDLSGAVCLVTGAAKRVGSEIALALAARGARVVVHYRSSVADAERTLAEIRDLGAEGACVQADLARHEEVDRLCREAPRSFGPVDALVNNASVFYPTPLEDVSVSQWDEILGVNLRAPFFLARTLGLEMKKRGRGKIVNIADWAGERPYARFAPYCISKAGMLAMTLALARELAPEVQVNSVSPGPVLPPDGVDKSSVQGSIAATLVKRLGSPEDVANAVLFFLEGTDFSTGANLHVDGGRHV